MRRTRRGAGMPGRPPHVWVNVTDVLVTFGLGRMSGKAVAWNTISLGPSFMWVTFSTVPPDWP